MSIQQKISGCNHILFFILYLKSTFKRHRITLHFMVFLDIAQRTTVKELVLFEYIV